MLRPDATAAASRRACLDSDDLGNRTPACRRIGDAHGDHVVRLSGQVEQLDADAPTADLAQFGHRDRDDAGTAKDDLSPILDADLGRHFSSVNRRWSGSAPCWLTPSISNRMRSSAITPGP